MRALPSRPAPFAGARHVDRIGIAHGPDPFLAGGPFGQNEQLEFRWRDGRNRSPRSRRDQGGGGGRHETRASKAPTFVYGVARIDRLRGRRYVWGQRHRLLHPRAPPTASRCGFASRATSSTGARSSGARRMKDRRTGATTPRPSPSTSSAMSTGSGTTTTATTTSTTSTRSSRPLADQAERRLEHARFGRCDTATLQVMYDMPTTAAKFSTCLDLSTVLTIAASPTPIMIGGATTLTATLKVVDADVPDARRELGLGPDGHAPASRAGRDDVDAVGTMPAGPTGTYVLTQRPSGDHRVPGRLQDAVRRGHQRRHLAGREGFGRSLCRGRPTRCGGQRAVHLKVKGVPTMSRPIPGLTFLSPRPRGPCASAGSSPVVSVGTSREPSAAPSTVAPSATPEPPEPTTSTNHPPRHLRPTAATRWRCCSTWVVHVGRRRLKIARGSPGRRSRWGPASS